MVLPLSLVCKAPNIVPTTTCKLLVASGVKENSTIAQKILSTQASSAIGIEAENSIASVNTGLINI